MCLCVSVPGADRRGAGAGERLYIDPRGRAGQLQRSGRAVEDAAGGDRTGAGQHQRGVSVYESYVFVIMFFISEGMNSYQYRPHL